MNTRKIERRVLVAVASENDVTVTTKSVMNVEG